MAKQSGHIFIQGTLDDITYYKMDGVYYVRMKSSLSREKVLKSPRFERTRQHASQLAEASKIASAVYKEIPKEERGIKLFRTIVGKAKVLLTSGMDKEAVLEVLLTELRPQTNSIVSTDQEANRSDRKGFKQRSKGRKEAKRVEKSELLSVNKEGRLVLEPLTVVVHPHKAILKTNNIMTDELKM